MTITISTNAAALANTTLATRAIHAGQEPDPTTGRRRHADLHDLHVQAGRCGRTA